MKKNSYLLIIFVVGLLLPSYFTDISFADESYSTWLKSYLKGQADQAAANVKTVQPIYTMVGVWIEKPAGASLESGEEVRYEASDMLVAEEYRKKYVNLWGRKTAYNFEGSGWTGQSVEEFTYNYPEGSPNYGASCTAVSDKKWETVLTFQPIDKNTQFKITKKNDEVAKHKEQGNVLYEIHKSDSGSILLPSEFKLGEPAVVRFESDLNSNLYSFGLREWLSWGVHADGDADKNYYNLPELRPNIQRIYSFLFDPQTIIDKEGKAKLYYIPILTEGSTSEWDNDDISSFTYQSTFEHQPYYDLKNPKEEYNACLSIPSPSSYPIVFVQYSLGNRSRLWKCTPLELPAIEVSGDGAGEVSALKGEHARLIDELKTILQKEPPAPKKDGSSEAIAAQLAESRKKFDEEIINKDQEIRSVEKKYFDALSTCYGSANEAGLAALREALRTEAVCLSKARTEAIDEMREQSFRFIPNSAYFRCRRYYEAYFKDLKQILNIWSNVNRMEILRLDMLISELLKGRAAHEPDCSDMELLSLQNQLKNVYVDEAVIHSAREQCMAEDTLDGRDSYGAALAEARKQNLKQPWHNDFIKRQSQRAIYGTQYLMGTFGTLWTVVIDSINRIRSAPAKLLGATSFISDMHSSTDKSINDVRTKIANRLAVIDALYSMGPDGCKWMGAFARGDDLLPPEGINGKIASDMENDRTFHEASGGGLMRLAACYEMEKAPRLEWEYRIELKHGKLCWADMRKTLYLREVRKESGEDPLLRRMVDPMGAVKTSAAHYIGKQYDGAEDYLSERKGQLMEMEGLLPLFKKINFDLDIGITKYPTINQTHAALCQNNPDYMKFMQSYRMLWSREREIELFAAMSTAETSSEREEYEFKLDLLKNITQREAIPDFIRILKQQLSDKIAASDFDGALILARQIEDVATVEAKGLTKWLSQDFAWEQAKEVGINTAVSIGNQGLYAAFFARYLSPAAVRNQPVSFSNIKKVFSTWKGFGGMLEFTWGQVNPFANLMKTMEPKEMAVALAKTTLTGLEQVTQEQIKQSIFIGYFGLDEKYADFLANVVINFEQMQREDPTSLTSRTARNLLRQLDAYTPDVINLPGWQRIMKSRVRMREYWMTMDALAQLEKIKLQMQDARKSKKVDLPKLSALGSKFGKIMLKIRLAISPLNAETIRLTMDDYQQKLSAAKTPIERVAAHSELFRTMPFAALVSAKKAGNLPKDMEAKIDLARRDVLSTIQTEFLKAYPGMAPYIERYIYTGSGARDTWPEYKKISSDLDFTLVLRAGVDIKIKNNIKQAFDAFFEKTAKFPPEEFDVHSFVDERPNLACRGETADQLIALVKDPSQAGKLSAETQRNIETLLADLGDPERYLSTGAVRFLNYLNKLGGRVKKPVGGKLENDDTYQAELYKDVKFEPWMGLEIVLDNLKLIEAHAPKDRLEYAGSVSKYALRILLARIIQSDAGLEMINKLDIAEIEKNLETTGGIHGEFVRIAESLGGKFSDSQLMLFRELNLKKQGKSWGEVLAERNGGKIMDNDDPALNAAIEKHAAEVETFMQESIRETAVTHATEMKKISDAVQETSDPSAQKALLDKYREILYSTATVWDALPENLRKNVIAASPGMDEVYRALEDVRQFFEQKRIDLIRNYNPFQKSGEVPKGD
ncbi:MAG: hypothetical protein QME05_00265 [Candidatus Margulisbacteria bacterium]|nr:hypothetical protein [Candidatus Margulisiibacteriota bacterium]